MSMWLFCQLILQLTVSQAPAENFPFCTIEPNHSQVAVPDDRCTTLLPLTSRAKMTLLPLQIRMVV